MILPPRPPAGPALSGPGPVRCSRPLLSVAPWPGTAGHPQGGSGSSARVQGKGRPSRWKYQALGNSGPQAGRAPQVPLSPVTQEVASSLRFRLW